MSIAADPNQTYTVTIRQHALTFRYMTVREWMNYASRREAISEESKHKDTTTEAALTAIRDLISGTLVTPVDLFDILSPRELVELRDEVSRRCVLGDGDKKKSDSPSPSDTASSAPDAAAESA